jgi:hypothetical protein
LTAAVGAHHSGRRCPAPSEHLEPVRAALDLEVSADERDQLASLCG